MGSASFLVLLQGYASTPQEEAVIRDAFRQACVTARERGVSVTGTIWTRAGPFAA